MSKTYEISEELVIGLLEYLGNKPYNEVSVGIEGLKSLKEIEDE